MLHRTDRKNSPDGHNIFSPKTKPDRKWKRRGGPRLSGDNAADRCFDRGRKKKKTKTAVLGPSLRVVSPVYRVAQQHSDRSLEGEKGCGSVLARGRSKCMITRKIQEPPVHLLKCLANQYTPTALTLGTVQTTIQGFLRILRGRRRARRWSMGRLRGRPREAGRLEGFL